jgi:hypothetical protein
MRPRLNSLALTAACTLATVLAPATTSAQSRDSVAALERAGMFSGYRVTASPEAWPGDPFFAVLAQEGTGRTARWVVREISFDPIERTDPNVEVVGVIRVVAGAASDRSVPMVVPAFVSQPRDLGTTDRPIDERGFDCGSVTTRALNREIPTSYNLCNSAFSRRDGFATGALLVIAGPAGAGTYKRFDREALAAASLSAGLPALLARVRTAREAAFGSEFGVNYDPGDQLLTALGARLDAALDRSWTHGTTIPEARQVLQELKSALRQSSAVRSAYSTALQSRAIRGRFAVAADGSVPELEALFSREIAANAGRSPNALAALPNLLAAIPADPLGCTGAQPIDIATAARNDVQVLWQVRCSGDLQAALAGQANALRFAVAPIGWRALPENLLTGWQAADSKLEARVEDGGLVLVNRSNSFVTIRSIARHLGGDIDSVTATGQDSGGWIIPPGAEARQANAPSSLRFERGRFVGVRDGAFQPSAQGATGFAPISVETGFSVLYEADGRTSTLSRLTPIRLEAATN